jgi:hypothetical protein
MTCNWIAVLPAARGSLSCLNVAGPNARSTRIRLTSEVAVSRASAALPNSTAETRSSPSVSRASSRKLVRTVATLAGKPSNRVMPPADIM